MSPACNKESPTDAPPANTSIKVCICFFRNCPERKSMIFDFPPGYRSGDNRFCNLQMGLYAGIVPVFDSRMSSMRRPLLASSDRYVCPSHSGHQKPSRLTESNSKSVRGPSAPHHWQQTCFPVISQSHRKLLWYGALWQLPFHRRRTQ